MIVGTSSESLACAVAQLEGADMERRAASAPVYREKTIECPCAYLKNPAMYKHLLALAQDAFCILFTLHASYAQNHYSPGFARAFSKPVFGAVAGAERDSEEWAFCEKKLRHAGVVSEIFCLPDCVGETDTMWEKLCSM